jgi:tetratricopeptide (TPR) repeat protein
VATHLNNIASVLVDTNRLAEAEPLYRRALAIDEGSLGPDDPAVSIHLSNLAGLLQNTNRPTEAEPLMRRALTIIFTFERDTGHEHPYRGADIQNYADLLTAMGHDEAAIRAKIDSARREAGLG